MRDYGKVAPQFWTGADGKQWKTPTIKGRLKMRIPSHRALREFVIARDKVCKWCGTGSNLIADHIVSRRNGGEHHPDNLQALCQSCNSRKVGLVDARPM